MLNVPWARAIAGVNGDFYVRDDPTYGGDPVLAAKLGLERQWLHAVELAFIHPRTNDEVRFTSDYPEDLAEADYPCRPR